MAEKSEDAKSSPKRRPPPPKLVPRAHPEVPKEPPPRPANVEALMKLAAVARVLAAGINRDSASESDADSAATGQKGHRFQRAISAEKPLTDVSASNAPAQATVAKSESESEPFAPSSPERPSAKPAAGRTSGGPRPSAVVLALRKHPFIVWIVVQVFCFGLVLLGILIGVWGFGPPTPPAESHPRQETPPRPAVVSTGAAMDAVDATTARALDTANLAFAKEEAGDLVAAQSLLESLADAPTPLPGTEYQLAWLALRRNDQANAELHLERSIVANEAVAPCCYLRAAFAGAKGDYHTASAELRLAAQAEPFSGRYFFYWGESLRRNGQLQDAAKCLRQALARPCTPEERELFRFKLRLAQLEAGSSDPFSEELEEKLRQPSPTGDWLLLAAAQNVQRTAYAAAAEFLQRAARLLPPQTYRTWVGDYIFQNHAAEREIAPILRGQAFPPADASTPAPAVTGAPAAEPMLETVVAPMAPLPAQDQQSSRPAAALPPDPTVCSPAEGDPALWQSAAPST